MQIVNFNCIFWNFQKEMHQNFRMVIERKRYNNILTNANICCFNSLKTFKDVQLCYMMRSAPHGYRKSFHLPIMIWIPLFFISYRKL